MYVAWLWGSQKLREVKDLDHHLTGSKTLAMIITVALLRFAFWLKELNFGESPGCPGVQTGLRIGCGCLSSCSYYLSLVPLLILGSQNLLPLIRFFPGTRIYALVKPSPRGPRAIFMIFSLALSILELVRSRSGGAVSLLPDCLRFLHHEIPNWR